MAYILKKIKKKFRNDGQTLQPTPLTPPKNVDITKSINFNNCVITTNETLWGPQLKQRMYSVWDKIATENGRILILSGAHGTPEGFMKRTETLVDKNCQPYTHNAIDFIADDEKMANNIKKEKAADFARLGLEIMVEDVWKFMNVDRYPDDEKEDVNPDGDKINTSFFREEMFDLSPTTIVAGWCHSAPSQVLLEKLGLVAIMKLHDDQIEIFGKR